MTVHCCYPLAASPFVKAAVLVRVASVSGRGKEGEGGGRRERVEEEGGGRRDECDIGLHTPTLLGG